MQNNWNFNKIKELFNIPFLELIYKAQKVHRKYFNPNEVQVSTLLSIKTGNCPENCKYCSQSSRYKSKTEIKPTKLLSLDEIISTATKAKRNGTKRFCMGAAWKSPKDSDIPFLKQVISKVKSLGMEVCMTLGMLSNTQAIELSKSGLDYYNHNLDTSREYYKEISNTRTFDDRLHTLNNVRSAGIKICSGGIIGLGEQNDDRIKLLIQLSNLSIYPESIPINLLVKNKGTLMENNEVIDPIDFVKIIAITRILMPNSYIRLSAGRSNLNYQTQTMCLIAGVNSVFYGCKLLTTPNAEKVKDLDYFEKLNLKVQELNKLKSIKRHKLLDNNDSSNF